MSKPKLALKRLTASDLTLFKWHFENKNAGNQKAINLNRDVFVDVLYPALPDAIADHDGRLPLDLRIYGPDGKPELNLQRKVLKHGAYKNWRLDGEFINNPDDDPSRFNSLEAGDIAVLDFTGGVLPTSLSIVFVENHNPRDVPLYRSLESVLGKKTMAAVSEYQLAKIINETHVDQTHPIHNIIIDEALEDAVSGGPDGAERLWRGVSSRHLSREALEKARRKSEDNGRTGEQIVNDYLLALRKQGQIDQTEWTSEEINPVAPYDFKIHRGEECFLIDVKSTDGEYDRRLHISMNEIRQMANGSERYDIYRLYEIGDTEAKMRIASDLRNFAQTILSSLSGLPQGVTPNGFTIDPEILDFGGETVVRYPDDETG